LLTLAQPVLFGVVLYLHSRVEPEQYRFDKPVPHWYWARETFWHSLRAADFVDCIEEWRVDHKVVEDWKFDVLDIRAVGDRARWILFALHINVALCVIPLGLQALAWWRSRRDRRKPRTAGLIAETIQEEATRRRRKRWRRGVLFVVVVGWTAWSAHQHQWNAQQLGWWCLDQLARTADIGDYMQLWHQNLHGVKHDDELRVLAVMFRYCVAITAMKIAALLLTWLGLDLLTPEHTLRERLVDPDPIVRDRALRTLCRLKYWWNQLTIVRMLELKVSPEPEVREQVDAAIRRVVPRWASDRRYLDLLPVYIEGYRSEDPGVRYAGTNAITAFGPLAVEPLRKLQQTGDAQDRAVAVSLLGILGASRDAIDVLLNSLNDSNAEVVRSAEQGLINLGAVALPGVIARMGSANPATVERLMQIIRAAGKAGLPALVRRFAGSDRRGDEHVQSLLREAGRDSVPHLLKCLRFWGRDVRVRTLNMLGAIGQVRPEERMLILKAADSRRRAVREAATAALKRLR
jgi:HEAT repeat protein